MENKKTTIFQAYKLYHCGGFVKDTFLATLISVGFMIFLRILLLGNDTDSVKLIVLIANSMMCFISSSSYIFSSLETKAVENVFRTVKEPVDFFQKQHIAGLISGIAVIVLNHLIIGAAFSCISMSMMVGSLLLLIRAIINIFSIIKKDAVRVLAYIGGYFAFFPVAIALCAIDNKDNSVFQMGNLLILFFAVLAAIIFVLSEKYVLKSFRNNWYKD